MAMRKTITAAMLATVLIAASAAAQDETDMEVKTPPTAPKVLKIGDCSYNLVTLNEKYGDLRSFFLFVGEYAHEEKINNMNQAIKAYFEDGQVILRSSEIRNELKEARKNAAKGRKKPKKKDEEIALSNEIEQEYEKIRGSMQGQIKKAQQQEKKELKKSLQALRKEFKDKDCFNGAVSLLSGLHPPEFETPDGIETAIGN